MNSLPSSSLSESQRKGTYLDIPLQGHFDNDYAQSIIDMIRQTPLPLAPPAPTPVQTFPFLALPAELRNDIYKMVLQRECVQRLRNFVTPALSRTCQQLRHETLPLFIHLNTFIAEVKASCGVFTRQALRSSDVEYPTSHCVQRADLKELGLVSIDQSINPLSWKRYAMKVMFRNIDIILLNSDRPEHEHVVHEAAVLSLRADMPKRTTSYVNYDDEIEDNSHLSSPDRDTFIQRKGWGLRMLLMSPDVAMTCLTWPKRSMGQGITFIELQSIATCFRLEDTDGEMPQTLEEVDIKRNQWLYPQLGMSWPR